MKLRKAIGAIILNSKNQIIAFQRSDYKNNWQCPEGGIEEGETPLKAMYREVLEEVGLSKECYNVINTREKPFVYMFIDGPENHKGYNGQEKQFFILKLKDDNFKFKLDTKEDEIEFIDYKTLENNKDLIELVPSFKKEMYREILEYFKL